ncbi:DUF2290 domain-containing protein [Microbacterium wangruii]|uniref:DUF2290 domain-containing protein n=1 Tax=Microbacterium wangruii TaxID=3049073 RepID=UPI00256F39B6|nr:DUF2290 domain-containing protein [Microbacterium sp. zg-Y1211]MDL5486024.1 DUF2290 domain-containing protein [Microbacterium sp. zg-Y1211]
MATLVRDVVHPVSHVAFGQHQHCRVRAVRAVTPSEFLSFILASFYSTPEHPQTWFVSSMSVGAATITVAEAAHAHIALP